MNRFLGSKSGKPKVAAPTLGEVSTQQQGRIDELQGRIGKLDTELVKYREQVPIPTSPRSPPPRILGFGGEAW